MGKRDQSVGASERDDPQEQFRLADRLALRPAEAARVLGVSERKLREMLPEMPHLRTGGAVLIPVDALREWLREQSKAQHSRAASIANDIYKSVAIND